MLEAKRKAARGLALACLLVTAGCGSGRVAADAPPASPAPQPRAEAPAPPALPAQSFAEWRSGFRARALAAGIGAGTFDAAFAGVTVNQTVLERDRFQPEFTRPIWEYLDSAVSDRRIADGRVQAAAQAGLLAEIERRYGVDREVVVAIWGLESAYGATRGDIPVIEALATLAYDGRRRDFAETQLIAALRILDAGHVRPAAMRGSWAGAMGHTQFIPTSFLELAVDHTGDGRRDIWADDPADALASAANYLSARGWRRDAPIAVPVRLPPGFDYRLADARSVQMTPAEWAALGLMPRSGGALPAGGAAGLILPAGAEGPAFLAYPNFRVILTYNNATSYALAIARLSALIAGRASEPLAWPREQRSLSRTETQTLQRRLTALGYDTQGADGVVGPNTRAAVRAFQSAEGLTPDGHVSGALLEAVLAAGG